MHITNTDQEPESQWKLLITDSYCGQYERELQQKWNISRTNKAPPELDKTCSEHTRKRQQLSSLF